MGKTKEELAEYKRQHYLNNKDTYLLHAKESKQRNEEKVALYKKAYYLSNKDKLSKQTALLYENNKETVLAKVKAYSETHAEAIKLYKQKYRSLNRLKLSIEGKDYRLSHIQEIIAYRKEYRNRNPLKIVESLKKYYEAYPEKLKQLTYRKYVTQVIKLQILDRDKFSCVLCKSSLVLYCHHIKPVKICSPEEIIDTNNLITLCKACHKLAHAGDYRKIDDTLAEQFREYIKLINEDFKNGI